ncbi:MAG: TadE family protein [Nocardioides sp.]
MERGSVTVEFALILIPFLVLLFGMVQFSIWFFSAQSGSSAAREAARRSAVGDLSCAQLAVNATGNAELVQGGVTVSRTYYDGSYATVSDSTPTKGAGQVAVGDNVRVLVRYRTMDLHFPFIPIPSAGGVRAQIVESATVRVESVTANTVPC